MLLPDSCCAWINKPVWRSQLLLPLPPSFICFSTFFPAFYFLFRLLRSVPVACFLLLMLM